MNQVACAVGDQTIPTQLPILFAGEMPRASACDEEVGTSFLNSGKVSS